MEPTKKLDSVDIITTEGSYDDFKCSGTVTDGVVMLFVDEDDYPLMALNINLIERVEYNYIEEKGEVIEFVPDDRDIH